MFEKIKWKNINVGIFIQLMACFLLVLAVTYVSYYISKVSIGRRINNPIGFSNFSENNIYGLVADYYRYRDARLDFSEYVSSKIVGTPYVDATKDSKKRSSLEQIGYVDGKGVQYNGGIKFPEEGMYKLFAECTQGIFLSVNKCEIINDWENKELRTVTGRSFYVEKDRIYDLCIKAYNLNGADKFVLYYSYDDEDERKPIPDDWFVLPEGKYPSISKIYNTEGNILHLEGDSLDSICKIEAVPYSLASVKSPVECVVKGVTEKSLTAVIQESLVPGTYRMRYETTDERICYSDTSFFVQAEDNGETYSEKSKRASL